MIKLGALWKNKNGKDMFTGNIEIDGKSTRLVVFTNGYKTEDKHPDYIIYLKEPKTGEAPSAAPSGDNPFVDESKIPF
ncbi:MAG TPA: hypothetical protein DCO75_06360 [Fibrobacteres bacterium]|nr:hypothetical protein [Fibrobacterota bacterium]